MSPTILEKQKKSARTDSAILAEYNALRTEMMKRIELRYQFINFTLIIAGAFLAAGTQGVSTTVLLFFPIFVFFLASGWAHNGIAVSEKERYIREQIETKIVGLKWETYTKEHHSRSRAFGFLGSLSTSGLFLTAQLMTIGYAILKFSHTNIEIVLLVVSILFVVFTIAVIVRMMRTSR